MCDAKTLKIIVTLQSEPNNIYHETPLSFIHFCIKYDIRLPATHPE